MDDRRRAALEFVASQLALVVGLLHVGTGAVNWFRYARAGLVVPPDARWPAFVLSGVAVLAGFAHARRAADRRPYYAVGVVAMLGYAVGYFAWHLGGHRLLLVAGRPTPEAEVITVHWFVDHLLAGPLETVSVVAEVGAVVALLLAD